MLFLEMVYGLDEGSMPEEDLSSTLLELLRLRLPDVLPPHAALLVLSLEGPAR